MSGAQNGQWRWYEMLELEYASSSYKHAIPCVILMAFQDAWIETEHEHTI